MESVRLPEVSSSWLRGLLTSHRIYFITNKKYVRHFSSYNGLCHPCQCNFSAVSKKWGSVKFHVRTWETRGRLEFCMNGNRKSRISYIADFHSRDGRCLRGPQHEDHLLSLRTRIPSLQVITYHSRLRWLSLRKKSNAREDNIPRINVEKIYKHSSLVEIKCFPLQNAQGPAHPQSGRHGRLLQWDTTILSGIWS